MKNQGKSALAAKVETAATTLFSKRQLDFIADFFAADYLAHLTEGEMSGGHDLVRRFLTALFRSFPKLAVEVEILAEEGDRIVWLRTLRGVQQGAVQGFPASGREVVWRDAVTTRFRDGLIAEEWIVSDLVERLLRARKQAKRVQTEL